MLQDQTAEGPATGQAPLSGAAPEPLRAEPTGGDGRGEEPGGKRPQRPRARPHRALRLGVEILGGLFATVILVVGFVAWRLSEGPIRTDFLTPYLQSAVNGTGGNTIAIGNTFLVWEPESHGLVLHAANVVVRDPGGKRIASLPEVAFQLSSGAILQGTLAPHEIEIIAPRIRLLRAADGTVRFGSDATMPALPDDAAADADHGSGEDVVLGTMIQQLLADRTSGNALSFLDEVRVRDGQLYVRDERLGLSWAAPSADISLRRDIAGLAGDISLSFTSRRDPATLDASFLFDKKAGVVDFAAGFSDISLANLATAFPVLAPVGGLTSRISGSVSTSVSLDGTIGHTGFELQGFSGTLTIPGIDMAPLPVSDLTMRGRYDATESRFDLDEARIALGSAKAPGPVLSLAGVFDYDPLGGDWSIDTNATLENVPLADLATYWPQSIAGGARPWVVKNVTRGMVDKATAKLAVTVPHNDFSAAAVTGLTGTVQYQGLEVHYLRPLPAIQSISGTGTFNLDSLHFAVQSGRLQGLAFGKSTVDITDLGKSDPKRGIYEQLAIDGKVVGPVHDALAIIAHERLDLLSKLGFSAEGSDGSISAELGFQIPLAKNLTFDDVSLHVEAATQDAVLKHVVLGQDMTDGRLKVSLDQSGMQLSGPLTLGGVPLNVRWRESFADAPKVRSVMEAKIARIDDAQRARFGLDIGDAVQGPLAATVSMVAHDGGLSTLKVSTDLKEATVAVPEIHWRKAVGVPGSLSLTIEMDSSGPLAYHDIVLQAGDLVARGDAKPGLGGHGFSTLHLTRAAFGRSNLQDVALKLGPSGIDVSIGQGTLDAEPFLTGDDTATDGRSAKTPYNFEPLSVKAPHLNVLYFAGERRLEQVNLELRRGRAGWDTIRLSGSIPQQYWSPRAKQADPQSSATPVKGEPQKPAPAKLDRRYLQFSFAPDATGSGQRLLAQSDDLGALLRAVNLTDTVIGGHIQVTGASDGPTPSHPIKAKVTARDFVMVKAPALAKLLTVASFTGVLDLLRGDGIGFQGMDGEFLLDDGVATTDLMRIYGAALGLTAKGQIDFNKDAVDLSGVVVPAYSINNFLSKIPLLGKLLTGGEGEGLIAMVYSVKGGVEDPEVSVNPLSALTPGFLRNIFTAEPGDTPPRALPEDWKEKVSR